MNIQLPLALARGIKMKSNLILKDEYSIAPGFSQGRKMKSNLILKDEYSIAPGFSQGNKDEI